MKAYINPQMDIMTFSAKEDILNVSGEFLTSDDPLVAKFDTLFEK